MGGRIQLIFGTLIAAIALTIVAFFAASLSDSFNLACALARPSAAPQRYAFHIKIPKFFGTPQVVWAGTNTYDLRIVRFDDTMIIADLDQQLSGWPDKADSMSFRFNRVTGDAEMNYLQKPKETDQWPGWPIMQDFSEVGHCSKSERVF
jgi:hypothetical protein